MWIFRVLAAFLFLFYIVFTIPLAFDVGGRECGLAFSLSLAIFYFLYSVLRLTTPSQSRLRYALIKLVGWLQWFAIPALMIWSLNKFSVDSENNKGWVERTFSYARTKDTSIVQWLLGKNGLLENVLIGSWDILLRYSTPLFQLGEGFCSLLVIQAAGQITRWLVNGERGDTWMVSKSKVPVGCRLIIIDWALDGCRIHYFELCLLSLENHHFSRYQ